MRHAVRGLFAVCLPLIFATVSLFAETVKDRAYHPPRGRAATIPAPLDVTPNASTPSERPAVPDALPPISATGVNGLSLVGFISYQANWVGASGTAILHADRVENASSTRTSGTLRLTLWMSS